MAKLPSLLSRLKSLQKENPEEFMMLQKDILKSMLSDREFKQFFKGELLKDEEFKQELFKDIAHRMGRRNLVEGGLAGLMAIVGLSAISHSASATTEVTEQYIDINGYRAISPLPVSAMVYQDGATKAINWKGVEVGSGESSIRDALNSLTAGKLLIASGEYTITTIIGIGSKSDIIIEGHGDATILKTTSIDRIFNMDNVTNIVFKNLRLQTGYSGIGMHVNAGNVNNLMFENVTFEFLSGIGDTSKPFQLNADYDYMNKNVSFLNCRFINNDTTQAVRGIWVYGVDGLHIIDCRFYGAILNKVQMPGNFASRNFRHINNFEYYTGDQPSEGIEIHNVTDFIIANNILYYYGATNTAGSFGIYGPASRGKICNNVMIRCNGQIGIHPVEGSISHLTIENNYSFEPGQNPGYITGYSNLVAIATPVSPYTVSNIEIKGNVCLNPRSGYYCIHIGFPSDNLTGISNIRLKGNQGTIRFTGTTQVIFEQETQLMLLKGAGSAITGNATTSYATISASDNYFVPNSYGNIAKAYVVFVWNPQTTSGGIKLRNETDAVDVATSEPSATGLRKDVVDITSTIRGYTSEKKLVVQTKGDGVTAPTIETVFIRILIG